MPEITIDDYKGNFPEGTSILEAALEIGIDIPHFCYHPALSRSGNCRLCLVEVEGYPNLVTACTTTISNGMKVFTKTERVLKARRGILEFLLINHPLDCTICDVAGECEMQKYCYHYGSTESRYRDVKLRAKKRYDIGREILLDQERCIECERCVRFCREITGTGELGFYNRGSRTVPEVFPDKRLDNLYSGNVADICPVGALTLKDFRFKVRAWFLESVAGICPLCSRGCNIFVDHYENQVYRIRPRLNDKVNGYWICDIGRFGYHDFESGERLRSAEVRRGSGRVAAMMGPALSDAAESISSFLAKESAAKMGVFAAPFSTMEEIYVFFQFASSIIQAGFTGAHLPPDRDEDHLLLRMDKSPNAMGLKLIGESLPKEVVWGLDAFREGIVKGEVKGALILDGTPPGLPSPLEEQEELLSRLDLLVVMNAAKRPAFKNANVLLPLSCFIEHTGTYVNYQKRIQLQRKGIEPPREVRPAWAYLEDLSNRLGGTLSAGSSDEIFRIMSRTVPPLSGISYKDVALGGVELRS